MHDCDLVIAIPSLSLGGAPHAPFIQLIHHPAKRRMLPVLDLDPVRRSTRTIWSVTMLRNQSVQPHHAGVTKQVRADLALLERRRTRRASSLARSNPSQRRAPCAPSQCMIIIPRTASALASVTVKPPLHTAARDDASALALAEC